MKGDTISKEMSKDDKPTSLSESYLVEQMRQATQGGQGESGIRCKLGVG